MDLLGNRLSSLDLSTNATTWRSIIFSSLKVLSNHRLPGRFTWISVAALHVGRKLWMYCLFLKTVLINLQGSSKVKLTGFQAAVILSKLWGMAKRSQKVLFMSVFWMNFSAALGGVSQTSITVTITISKLIVFQLREQSFGTEHTSYARF